MPNGTYGGVRGKETKVGQKTFVSRPTRFFRQENNISSKLKQLVPKQLFYMVILNPFNQL